MPSTCLLIDPGAPDLKARVTSLAKISGICVFIDITGSTAMKCSSITEWVAKIYNCFANPASFLPPEFKPIKSIGDALMYYIEGPDLQQSGYTPLQIFEGLWQLATEEGPEFSDVKIGAAWCENVYPITFFPGSRDYYGIDIDLTARLQSLANNKEIVIDSRLYDKVTADFNHTGNRDDFVGVKRLNGPEKVVLKGISHEVLIYRSS